MKNEQSTRCGKLINGVRCRGATISVWGSAMEEYLGHRRYVCDACGQQWKFTDTVIVPRERGNAKQ